MKRIALWACACLLFAIIAGAILLQVLEAPRFDVPEPNNWIFRDVMLVEPGRAPRRVEALHIGDRKITAIVNPGSVDAPKPPRQSLEEIELTGLFVSPGLTDLHVHYPPRIAIGNAELWSLLLLAHGVTSVRETGSIDGSIFEVRQAIRDGRFPGPRIFACGEMLDGEAPSFPTNRILATAVEAREVVADLAARGADCIKVYNKLTSGVLAAIREAAAHAGLPVIGHAPHAVPLEEAGLVDLQHGTGAVVVDRERVGRLDFRFQDWLTMDDARIEKVARISLDQGIAHTPTLVNTRMRRLLAEQVWAEEVLVRDSGLRHLPRFWGSVWRTIWASPFTSGDPDSEALERLFRTRQAAMTSRLHHAGVRIHAGTDTLMPFVAPGSSLHGELEDLVSAGIAPAEVFEIATRKAGHSLGLPGLGTLAVGAPADLIFLRADPANDVSALRQIEAVLADGRLYRRSDFDTMLAAADAHFHGAIYDGVMSTLASLLQEQFAPDPDPVHRAGLSR